MDEVLMSGVNALATLMVNSGWEGIRGKVMQVLARRRTARASRESGDHPDTQLAELEQVRQTLRLPDGTYGGVLTEQARQQLLDLWLIDAAAGRELRRLATAPDTVTNETHIVIKGNGPTAINSGQGDQHNTFGT